jgi:glycerol-3-phosphate acyltransferase PlsX
MGIAVDAMGGDRAPAVIVEGAVMAAREGTAVVLVGREAQVRAELDRLGAAGLPIDVRDAPGVVAMSELSPAEAVRSDPDSSISRAMTLLRHGEAEAVITMGHTGAGLAAALLRLGRIPGVRRPALAAPFPTQMDHPCVLLDIGANADVRPEDLFQFGVMGAAYAEGVLGVHNPRVGLVSIGEEAGKGNHRVQEAWPLLQASPLNFVGNLEGRDITAGAADVAVVDGFTGNVIIKFAEGLSTLIQDILRDAAMGDPLGMLGGLLMRPAIGRARRRLDYRTYGGAALLGVRGMVVIGHGRSDATAVKVAIDVARKGVESDVAGAIERGVAAT